MIMEIKNDYYESLLEDPVEETQEEQNESVQASQPEDSSENEPLLPSQPSDEDYEPAPAEAPDLISSFLMSKGISDPSKIQFENEDGTIEERDFKTIPMEEQLTMLNELSSQTPHISDYEQQVLDFVRKNGGDLNAIVAAYQNKAVQDYINAHPAQSAEKTYRIDDYSDDELYIADLAVKFPDFTEEELNEKLEAAKTNEELYKKEVESLRAFYKDAEDQQDKESMEAQQASEQQQYEALQNSLLTAIGNFNEIFLDENDPTGEALEIEDGDRQVMLDYLLTPGTDGRSQFDKDLSDPAALIELAWLRTHGRDTLTGISQYWKKELADTRKQLAKANKELEKYRKNDNSDRVVVNETRPNRKNTNASSVSDLWG